MDAVHIASVLISLALFFVTIYEAVSVVSLIGRMPRFWFFFLAAIALVIANRILTLVDAPIASSAVDSDLVPVIFSALLLLWVYDMKKTFRRASPPTPTRELTTPEKVEPPNVGGVVARDDVDD